MEAAGVAVGILPLLVTTIKAYRDVCRHIHAFRRTSKELRIIRDELHVRNDIFLNQCHHLLRLVVQSDRDAEEMLEQPSHRSWTDTSLTVSLQKQLKRSYESCVYLMKKISERLEEMAAEVASLDRLVLQERKEEESVKDAIRRIGQSAKLSFQKAKYDMHLKELRESNEDLTQLIRDVSKLASARFKPSRHMLCSRKAPQDIGRIRALSDKLHQAMNESWCCQEPSHVTHFAKLCVDAEVDRGVARLDMVIAFGQGSTGDQVDGRATESEPPLWLYVQSEEIGQEGVDARNTKRRKIRPKDDVKIEWLTPAAAPASPATADENLGNSHMTVDLSSSQSVCQILQKYHEAEPEPERKHEHIGLLQTRLHKHVFFAGSLKIVPRRDSTCLSLKDLLSLDGLIQQTVEDSYTLVDQLKLAKSLAITTLRFTDTPWMGTIWRLQELAIFATHDQKFEELLATLHLSSQISGQSHRVPALRMEGVETLRGEDQVLTWEDFHGVNNNPLFSLSIALLEVGHWKPISKMRRTCDGDNDILTARRLANSSRATQLGPRFDDIIRRCMQCNFGFGTDLRDSSLQDAVWTDVVCQLEEMIHKLTISHTQRN